MRPRPRAPAGPPLVVALVAATVLAACAVDVDGAPCRVPGATADCPGGQACGNDGRCSARALACATSRCTPGAGGACLDPAGAVTTGRGAQARRCVGDDPVCGSWIVEPCAPGGLECDLRAPAATGVAGAWCVCPDPPAGSRELLVRPNGSLGGSAPFPTGAATPPACGFRRLTDALAEAGVVVDAFPTAVATVTAVGGGTDPATAGTVTFSGTGASAERFPLVVRGRVTLGSDAQAGGGTYEIVFDGEALPSAALVLHAGAALAGFTVRNGAGGFASDALALACDGPDPALLTSVALDGLGAGGLRLWRGVAAGAGCSLVARDLDVRNMATAGIFLDAGLTDPAPAVSITGGTIAGCGDGVYVRVGRVVLQSTRIERNADVAVRANDGLSGSPSVEIRNSKIVGNGNTGIAVGNASELRITGTTSSGNGWSPNATIWGGPPGYSASRKSGGMVLVGEPPSVLEFARNRIYGNGGDQVLVIGAATTWNLGPSSCSDQSGPVYSTVGCYDPTPLGTTLSYRGIVAVNATVTAQNWGWQMVTPSSNDVGAFAGTVTSPTASFCPGDANLCSEPP